MPKRAPKPAGGEAFAPPFPRGTSMADRLEWVIYQYRSKIEAAAAAGVTVQQLGRYERGATKKIPFEVVANLAAPHGFSLDWIWNGNPPVHTFERLSTFHEAVDERGESNE